MTSLDEISFKLGELSAGQEAAPSMQPQAPVIAWGRDANGLPVPMGQ